MTVLTALPTTEKSVAERANPNRKPTKKGAMPIPLERSMPIAADMMRAMMAVMRPTPMETMVSTLSTSMSAMMAVHPRDLNSCMTLRPASRKL
eukprot:CAMPEP_0202462372 /NCGR_PEP_ID=MMETSP1360-20130828/53748_1 /ASSEMBLY_ACC=CAM_ASM_000848 /TAXON_ID=515479 /ORGANISM="Licmophora paradoxa, Strain CCMP2313" /LENGTH=92 /DNA_ID=CAMNT_0049084831 /DNA_START=86 /DNA_END=364 /DNA_ORIENTATION=+